MGKRPKQTFLPIQMANRHTKRWSTLLITREMQIKTTVKYHLTPGRMAIIKKATDNKCSRGCGGMASLQHCWWECKLVQPLQRRVKRFLNKKKTTESPYDSAIFLLGTFLEKTIIQKHATQRTQQLYSQQPRHGSTSMCIKRKTDKEDVLRIYSGTSFSHKKNGKMPFAATWMDPEVNYTK